MGRGCWLSGNGLSRVLDMPCLVRLTTCMTTNTDTEYRAHWACTNCNTDETGREHVYHSECTPADCQVMHTMHFDALLELPHGHSA